MMATAPVTPKGFDEVSDGPIGNDVQLLPASNDGAPMVPMARPLQLARDRKPAALLPLKQMEMLPPTA